MLVKSQQQLGASHVHLLRLVNSQAASGAGAAGYQSYRVAAPAAAQAALRASWPMKGAGLPIDGKQSASRVMPEYGSIYLYPAYIYIYIPCFTLHVYFS